MRGGQPTPTNGPLKRSCDIAIIGGGVMGLSIAYQLAKRGVTDVVVLERGYFAQGASGRNGGGVRMQWSTELNIRLMQRSIALCRRVAQEIGVNVWFRQGGYLFLAKTEIERARMERNAVLQNEIGVPTRILSLKEAHKIVPQLRLDGFLCASYNPEDGVLFPWPFLWGYATQALKRGIEIHLYTDVTSIARRPTGFRLTTTKGALDCQRVINCAGAWSPSVARMVGVELPNRPHRHEILSTEPLKPFLGPMVSVLDSGLYFSQSMRGEIVTGITVPDAPDIDPHSEVVRMGSRLQFLRAVATGLTEVMPRLCNVKVLRQWAGPYDVSPDGRPILGEPPGGARLLLGVRLRGPRLHDGAGHGRAVRRVVGRRRQTRSFRYLQFKKIQRRSPRSRRHDHRIKIQMSLFSKDLLNGQNALITGGGSGINLAIAQALAAHGAAVTLIGRTPEKLAAAAATITEAGGRAFCAAADVRQYDALDQAIGQAHDHFGPLDIVVCGAAGNFPAPALGMSSNGFRAVIDIDLVGTYHTCRASFERLRRPGARVLNISATQAFIPAALQSHACAAKAGVDMLTRTRAIEWGMLGVRVNSLTPGPVADTEGMRRLSPNPQSAEKFMRSLPLQRAAHKSEIADVALFLCSPGASYITGSIVVVDGGQSLIGYGQLFET